MTPPPRGGHFSVFLVCLARDLIVHSGASLRCTAAVLALFTQRFGLDLPTPSFSTIRSWLLRLGCYSLCRPLPKDVPWAWFIDHTIQIGSQKLLVILGCPLADLPLGKRDLRLTDLRLIALVPMEQSDGALVDAQLEKATARTGVPRVIVSDHATDLKKAIEDFCKRHPGTAAVHDAAHCGANVLENRWERQPRWHEFLKQLSQGNQKMRQTAEAYLLAPTLRAKARFMNVGSLPRFAGRVLRLLDQPKPVGQVVEKYGWLLDYREELAGWEEEHRVVRTTIEQVRRHGVGANTVAALEEAWGQLSDRPGTKMVAGHMRVYARRYGAQAKEGETLPASTEALESSFGKLKRLQGEGAAAGFTGTVLALGALTGHAEEADVRQALDAVPNKEAEGWVSRALGATVGWLRRQILGHKEP